MALRVNLHLIYSLPPSIVLETPDKRWNVILFRGIALGPRTLRPNSTTIYLPSIYWIVGSFLTTEYGVQIQVGPLGFRKEHISDTLYGRKTSET